MRNLAPFILPFVCAALYASEHPLAAAKVGEWVEYRTVAKSGSRSSATEERQEVVQVAAGAVTLEVTLKLGGQEVKETRTVNLSEKSDPLKDLLRTQKCEAKETGRGAEALTCGGKAVQSSWVAYEITLSAGGQPLSGSAKIWTAPNVPFGGVVRIETDLGSHGRKTRELLACGGPK